MNKYTAVVAIVTFALGAVAGHSMTASEQANAAARYVTPIQAAAMPSAFELMSVAPDQLPRQSADEQAF